MAAPTPEASVAVVVAVAAGATADGVVAVEAGPTNTEPSGAEDEALDVMGVASDDVALVPVAAPESEVVAVEPPTAPATPNPKVVVDTTASGTGGGDGGSAARGAVKVGEATPAAIAAAAAALL